MPVLTGTGKTKASLTYGRGVDASSSAFLPSPTDLADNYYNAPSLTATVQRTSDGGGGGDGSASSATRLEAYSPYTFNDGLTTVSYTATDAAGNEASGCDVQVLVVACPKDVEMLADPGGRYATVPAGLASVTPGGVGEYVQCNVDLKNKLRHVHTTHTYIYTRQ